MDTTKVSYPARLILDRYGPRYDPPIKVFLDPQVIESDEDLSEVLAYYTTLESIRGAVHYTKTLTGVADVDRVMAERQAALEVEAGLRDPAPIAPPRPSALDRAYLAARAAFKGDKRTLKRLQEALPLVRGGQVEPLRGGNFRVTSWGTAFIVNGTCPCLDFDPQDGGWCTHRLAVALFVKTARLEAEDATNDEAGSAPTLPASTSPRNGDRPRSL
jgi:hypothetical protein